MSKYIGETEKNLARVFAEAAAAVALLLFDEAAALFGRRSEVQNVEDRCADLEVNHPVQRLQKRLQTRGGLAILATGLAVTAVLGLCLIQRRWRPSPE